MKNKFILLLALILSNSITIYAQNLLEVDKNTLTINYQGVADSVFIEIKGGDKLKLVKAQDKYWSNTISFENTDRLIVQYKILKFNNGTENSETDYQIFVGENVEPLYEKKERILGQIIQERIFSNSLKEKRELTIYLPENFDKLKSYPIIYLADGAEVEDYAYYVERLIDKKEISEIILVGIHSGVTPESDKLDMSKNKRTLEYLKGIGSFLPEADSTRYENHLSFFCEEIINYIQSNFSEKVEKRTLYGYSNGASFAVSASLEYPNLYKNIIALSIGWELSFEKANITDDFPKFYLAAGTLESDFLVITKKWAKVLKVNKKDFHLNTPISFHDDVMWRQEFLHTIKKIHGKL